MSVTITKLTNPANLPSAEVFAAAMSSNGEWLAVLSGSSPVVLSIYQLQSGSYVRTQTFSATGATTLGGVSMTGDGVYIAWANNGTFSGPITILKRTGSSFSVLGQQGINLGSTPWDCSFSRDGTYLTAVSGGTESFRAVVYKRSGDSFSALTIDTLPDSGLLSCSLSGDGKYLALGHGNFELIYWYENVADSYVKQTALTAPASSPNDLFWDDDGLYLAAAHNSSPRLTVYQRSGGTLSKLSNPATLPTGSGRYVGVTGTAGLIAIAHITSPFVSVYERDGSTLTKTDNPDTLPAGNGNALAISQDGSYMAVGHATTPFVSTYSIVPDPFWESVLENAAAEFEGAGILSTDLAPAVADFTGSGELSASLQDATSEFLGSGEWDSALEDAIAEFEAGSEWLSVLQDAEATFIGSGELESTLSPAFGDFEGKTFDPIFVGDSVTMSETAEIIKIFGGSADEQLDLSDLPLSDVIYVITDRLVAQGTTEVSASFQRSIVDVVRFNDLLRMVREILIAESLTLDAALTTDLTKLVAIVEALKLSGAVQVNWQAILLLSAAFAANSSTTAAFAKDIVEALQLDDSLAHEWVRIAKVIESAVLSSTTGATRVVTMLFQEPLELDTDLTVVQQLTAILADNVELETLLVLDGEVYAGWVLNTKTVAPSEYRNFNFNSMAKLGDRYYGANENGLYLLDGDTDDGDPIAMSIKTGRLDFGSPNLKRVEFAHLGYTASGKVVMKVTTSQGGVLTERWYEAKSPTAGDTREGRVKLGKGVKSRYWQFEWVNVEGADFELDKVNFDRVIQLARRV